MIRIADAFVLATTLVVGVAQVSASPLITLSNLELGGELDLEAPDSAASGDGSTTPAALSGLADSDSVIGEHASGVASAGRTFELTGEDSSSLDYPLTSSISFGIAYELEDAEDVAAALIENGVVQDDHLNHSLVVQTIWRFGNTD
ncbi:MAG: hypothetical protein AAF543_08370 [Pseudomonadota bacterium]